MASSAISRLSAAAVLLMLVAACATAKPRGPLLLHPVPPTLEGYTLAQGALVFAGPDFTVSARPWDYRLVAEELRRSGEASPFGEDEEAAGRFLFLRVRLENRSARSLVFNPMRASLLRQGDAPLVALDNADLYAFADQKIAEAEARARTFRRISFDGTVTVRGGETLERYLAFRTPREAPKQLILELDDLWLGPTSHTLRYLFETFPGRE